MYQMKDLLIYFLVLVLSNVLPAWCSGLEEIAALKCGDGELDFAFPELGYYSAYQEMPSYIIDVHVNQIWLDDQNGLRIIAIDENGHLLGKYDYPRDTRNRLISQVVGLFNDKTACVWRGIVQGTDLQTTGVWDMQTDHWGLIDIKFDQVDLTPYFKKGPNAALLRPPRVADDYIVFRPSRREFESLAFNRDGSFKGKVPYEDWSTAGVGIEKHLGYRDHAATFYLTEGGKFGAPVVEQVNLRLNDINPDVYYRFLKFDEKGRYYFIGFKSKPDEVKVVAIQYNPFTKRVDSKEFTIPCKLHQVPEITDGTVLPNGTVIFTGVQPIDQWDLEFFPASMMKINNPNSLRVKIWKIKF